MKELIIDCFAGGGGASVGIEMALGRPVDIAINHDPDAILMHKTNHPNTLHLTEDIFKVNLRKYVKDQHVALMWASPDCTSHSKAKGGKPRERGLRILPWAVYKHAKEILPDVILMEPIKTIDTSNRYGLVTAFITKYYKSGIGQGCDEPLHTITTSPGHFGLVSAFLIKYYGAGCGQMLDHPLGTITTKDRFGLVNVILEIKGEKYIIYDIFLRMLKPEELKLMQGFPRDYIINRDYNFKSYPVAKQVARIGNSVVPIMAQKLVEVNCPYLKVGVRVPNLNIDDSQEQLRFA